MTMPLDILPAFWPGLDSAAKAPQKASGSGTCSITSEATTPWKLAPAEGVDFSTSKHCLHVPTDSNASANELHWHSVE